MLFSYVQSGVSASLHFVVKDREKERERLPSSPFSQRGIVPDVMLSIILKKMATAILLASKDILKFEIKLKAPKNKN